MFKQWKGALGAALIAVSCSGLFGCGKSQGGMSMDDMMKAPPRAPELDKLESLVGTWEGTGEMTMAGMKDSIKLHSMSTVAWEPGKRVLVEHGEFKMGEAGEPMHGVGLWTYDPKEKEFIYVWCDSGMFEHGEAKIDGNTWHMHGKFSDPMTGKKCVSLGTFKMIDKNTTEWNFTAWNSMKTEKQFEMHGTNRRKS